MPSRAAEDNEEFKHKLQNPPKPVNSTEPSAEMQEYLDKLNSGELIEEERRKKQEIEKKRLEEQAKYKLFCNRCRRPTLKRTPQGMYSCGFCGAETNSPLRMACDDRPA